MKKHLKLPDLDLLNHLFYIDETSPSCLRWKNPTSYRVKPGDVAGTKSKSGHWSVRITTSERKLYKVHRIIYYMQTKEDPCEYEIDHVDGNRGDNTRLRKASSRQNAVNRKKHSKWRNKETTSSKYKGVCWSKAANKWCAVICNNGKQKHLGVFVEEKEAALAYNKAALDCFGEFAKLNKF